MRTYPGRSQRLTRSHSRRAGATYPCGLTPHLHLRSHDRGVDLKRRPPKSRPTAAPRMARLLSRPRWNRSPQGLRRPRFSFFRFTCQTARDPSEPHSPTKRRAVEVKSRRNSWLPIATGAESPDISEELRRHAVAPRRRRAELIDYIGVARRKSQHPPSQKIGRLDAGEPQSSSQAISVA